MRLETFCTLIQVGLTQVCTYVNIYEAFKINMVPKEARPAEDQGKAIRQKEEKMQSP